VEPSHDSVVEVPLEVTHLDGSDPSLALARSIDPAPGSARSLAPPGSAAPGLLAGEPIGAAA
jgi:hypothetical protein